jgi:hypothetical protein
MKQGRMVHTIHKSTETHGHLPAPRLVVVFEFRHSNTLTIGRLRAAVTKCEWYAHNHMWER